MFSAFVYSASKSKGNGNSIGMTTVKVRDWLGLIIYYLRWQLREKQSIDWSKFRVVKCNMAVYFRYHRRLLRTIYLMFKLIVRFEL